MVSSCRWAVRSAISLWFKEAVKGFATASRLQWVRDSQSLVLSSVRDGHLHVRRCQLQSFCWASVAGGVSEAKG